MHCTLYYTFIYMHMCIRGRTILFKKKIMFMFIHSFAQTQLYELI